MKKARFSGFTCFVKRIYCGISCAVVIVLVYTGCRMECIDLRNSSCETHDLEVCDTSSFDMQKFVTRNNESAAYGTAQAIKSVPAVGEVEWKANNTIIKISEDYYFLSMANYADTGWIGLEHWAYLRDVVLVRIDPFYIGEQKILSIEEFEMDSTVNYSRYIRSLDDYFDASWNVEEGCDSYVNVTFVDVSEGIVEGEFDLHFIIDRQSTLPGVLYAERIRFRCGKFRARID